MHIVDKKIVRGGFADIGRIVAGRYSLEVEGGVPLKSFSKLTDNLSYVKINKMYKGDKTLDRRKKIKEFWEQMPIGFINFLTIVSSVITIVTPIAGGISLKKLYPEKNVVFIIYIVTIIVLLAMFVIMFRYMIKYRKLLFGTKKVITSRFSSLNKNFRNAYFDILSYRKNGKLTIELLTVMVKNFLQKSLDDICEIYKEFSYQDISACIKYIDCVGEVDREIATIKTFVRSTSTDSKRNENDDNNSDPIFIKDNTDFYSILSPNSTNKKSYFYQRNLIKYAEDAEKNGDSYNNSTKNWERYYKSTIVVPISTANKRLFFNSRKDCYDVIGFLCIDSLSTDAFLEKDERYNIDVAQAFAAEMYVILNQYKHYLTNLTAKRGIKND